MNNPVNPFQKFALFETPTRYYIVASNNAEDVFKLLKIDRTDARDLVVNDDGVTYNQSDIQAVIHMLDLGNQLKPRSGSKKPSGALQKVQFHALLGFVRFVSGYYMVLVTKRRCVAVINGHEIFEVQGTDLVYLPSESRKNSNEVHYLKAFQSVDLSSNFYFSYSYPLTHTMQHIYSASKLTASACDLPVNERFLWNAFLLAPVRSQISRDWFTECIHGFIGQSDLVIHTRHIYMTLIARRSNQFAGTRFLRRGFNASGNVANEVQTEQIIHDTFHSEDFSSFVQVRGSIPLFWAQHATAAVVTKPQIHICRPGIDFIIFLQVNLQVRKALIPEENQAWLPTGGEIFGRSIDFLERGRHWYLWRVCGVGISKWRVWRVYGDEMNKGGVWWGVHGDE